MNLELIRYPKAWYYGCWFLYLCYCYAAFFPTGPVWGIHFIAYVPLALKPLLLVAGGLMLLPGIQQSLFGKVVGLFNAQNEGNNVRLFAPAIVAIISFILFRTFELKTDIYGDTINMLKWYGGNTTFDWHWITDVLSPHWVDNKEALTVALHRIVAYAFSLSMESSYRIMSELFGALFIFVWLVFVQKISSGPLRVVLALLGMFAGAIQVFFGHVENYPFGILTSTLFLAGLYFYIEEKLGTLAFVLLHLLALKAHIIAILFFPSVLVALAYHYRNRVPKFQPLFPWRSILRLVILPALAVGLALYIFVFHSWNEPYALSTGRQFQQTFLPIVSLPAPLDHYSLWSPYHFADFLNVLLLTSAPILAVLVSLLIFNRKDIAWSHPKVIVFALAALFPFLFFAAMNPTLSPVRDWDVYTLLFPPLLFFTSILMVQSKARSNAPAWLAQSLVFGALFTAVMVFLNSSSTELGLRLEDAGAYTYRSYYAGSAYIIARGVEDSSTIVLSHYLTTVRDLAKRGKPGNDGQIAGMMSSIARSYASAGKYDDAIFWEESAYKSDTSDVRNAENLAAYYSTISRNSECSNILHVILSKVQRNDTVNLNTRQLGNIMAQLSTGYRREGNDSLAIFWDEEARKSDPLNLDAIYALTKYYLRVNRPRDAMNELHSLPHDSISVALMEVIAYAASQAYGPDSALSYLYKAKAMAPSDNGSIDSLIAMERKNKENARRTTP